jgi:HEPN domain-containing protein
MSVPTPASDAQRWLRFAQAVLELGEALARSDSHPPHLSCYHAQQAGEKALKAVLIDLQIRFPFTHNLDVLRNLVPPTWNVTQKFPRLESLTQWVTVGRYPGNWPEATDQDARNAAAQARDVWETVLDDLDRHGLDVSAFR